MEIAERLEELKNAVAQAAATHNAIVGRVAEATDLLGLFPDFAEHIEARLDILNNEVSQSLAAYNATVGRLQECEQLLEVKNKSNECIDVEPQAE